MNTKDLEAVAEDLLHLAEDWGDTMADPDIRRGSAVLRMLLVERVYGKAWRAMGYEREPTVTAVDLNSVLGPTPRAAVEVALAGGFRLRGVRIASAILLRGIRQPPPVGPPPTQAGGFPHAEEFRLSQYMESPAAVINGRDISRQDVVKYIANVKGGVHLGRRTRRAETELVARMEKLEGRVKLVQTDGLLTELLAIGQAIGVSADAKALIERIQGKSVRESEGKPRPSPS